MVHLAAGERYTPAPQPKSTATRPGLGFAWFIPSSSDLDSEAYRSAISAPITAMACRMFMLRAINLWVVVFLWKSAGFTSR